eukprot:jgi/Mesvir1/13395/Mv16484-RA.1
MRTRDLDQTIKPTYRWLLEGPLKLTEEQAHKVVRRGPKILLNGWSALNTGFEGLLSIFGKEDVIQMVLQYPMILATSPASQRQKLEELRKLLGANEALLMARKEASLLNASIASLEGVLSYLEKATESSRVEVIASVARFPTVLRLSVPNNLTPKIDYLKEELQATPEDIKKDMSLLARSLGSRLRPRTEAMRAAGLAPRLTGNKVPLTRWSDEKFQEWLRKKAVEASSEDRTL